LREGRGNAFIVFLKRGRKEIAVKAGNFRGNYTRRPSRSCESHWKKMIGKSRLSRDFNDTIYFTLTVST